MVRCLLILLTFAAFGARAGNGNETTGARARALGGASVALTDGWSGVNNQGSLGWVNAWNFGVAYQNNFLLPELGLKALAVTAPIGSGTFALSGHSFGYARYVENRLGIGYGRKLSDKVGLGVQLNYAETRIGDIYGHRGTLVAEVGLLVAPSEKARVGIHVYNPTRSSLARFEDERIPTVLRVGAQYLFSKQVSGLVEVAKDIDRPVDVRTGIEYSLAERFGLRAGFATARRTVSFGFGYGWKNLRTDLAAHWNQPLGYGTTLSVAYRLAKRTP